VKCRPPENRVPEREEIDACRAYLDAQIDVIRPRVICTLGSPATKTLLDTNEGINALRGRLFDYRGFRLIPTFHPAYLLRNPAEKGKTWADIKKVLAEMAKAE
jgi:DNA polymerase